MRQYRAAIARDPAHAAALNNLGVVLADQQQVEEAIGHYRRALESEPEFADAHYNLANALRSRRALDEAVRHYREALRLEPEMTQALNNLGRSARLSGEIGRGDRAIPSRLVRLAPASAEAHNNLGASLGLQGKLDEAIAEFREALRVDPGHARARENLRTALEKAAGR